MINVVLSFCEPLGYVRMVLRHVSPPPSPAEVKIKALSSRAEEGSLLTAAPGCVESSFISRGNLTFAGPKEFNKDPRPPARPQPLTLLTAAVSYKLIYIQARCSRWSRRSADVKKKKRKKPRSVSIRIILFHPSAPHHHPPPPRPGGVSVEEAGWGGGGIRCFVPGDGQFY